MVILGDCLLKSYVDYVKEISAEKSEPDWMLDLRLNALRYFESKPIPNWGPSLDGLDMDSITPYVKPGFESKSWDDMPPDVRETYDKLGVPEAERTYLAGIGVQYDSEIVYSKMKSFLDDLGVVFMKMDDAVKEYPELIKKHFSKITPYTNNKFVALHYALWSGGVFLYVPKGVKLDVPLQGFFLMADESMGQFEHTLIVADDNSKVHYIEGCTAPLYRRHSLHAGGVEIYVGKNSHVRFTTIENWSKSVYNLNTKSSLVHSNGLVEWVSGTLGSKVTMLYPSSVLAGNGAKADVLTISFASEGQILDTGAKIYLRAPNTSAKILSKSVAVNGGESIYRGLIDVSRNSANSQVDIRCESLIDTQSTVATFPYNNVARPDARISHEASISNLDELQMLYLMSRGIDESHAASMIILGFLEPMLKKIPLEFAIEFNKIVEMEMNLA